ncbi:MAG: hypothetical protein A2511_07110 [Deltaproteobacteria bacterium RIFOXYD12_FULL_50_9]|nr:MAG: hypothetical protein A2511_07110 [Deltaproteobacteria bacterium RIFOXYD12_FULL_50_9]
MKQAIAVAIALARRRNGKGSRSDLPEAGQSILDEVSGSTFLLMAVVTILLFCWVSACFLGALAGGFAPFELVRNWLTAVRGS